jgi:hypothetical protein
MTTKKLPQSCQPVNPPPPFDAAPASTHAGASPVVVHVVQTLPPIRFVSQDNCSGFGFASSAQFLSFISRHRLPATSQGHLRIVDADDLATALRSSAKVRERRKPVLHNDDEFARAGLRVVKAGPR